AGGILARFKVKVACTTDDPADSLEFHRRIQRNPEITAVVAPAFRPDRVLDLTHADFAGYIRQLGEAANHAVDTYEELLEALKLRIQYFHDHGCRLSDHGFGAFPYEPASEQEAAAIYAKAMAGDPISEQEEAKYRTYTLLRLAVMYHDLG
ncbi:glucuronate isomerase, partial [Enterococcus gallinarum]